MQAFDFDKNISILRQAKGQAIPWHETTYPSYTADILTFAQSYFKSDEYDRNFDRTLRKHQFHEGLAEADVAQLANTSQDYSLIRAIVSAIIRGEKYTPGMWQALVQNGILLDLLVRERDLKQKA